LYAISGLLLYKLLLKLLHENSLLALLISLLFVAHPMHTEVVANIKSRDEILALMFLLLAAKELVKHNKITVLMLLYYLLALLSKESAIVFAGVLLFAIYKKGTKKNAVIALAALFAVTAVWFAWRYVALSNSPAKLPYTYADNSLVACGNLLSQKLTAICLLAQYILKSVFPTSLSYDYSYNQVPCVSLGDDMLYIIGSVILIASTVYAAFKYRKKSPAVAYGIAFFYLTILPTSNVVFLIGSTMADRFVFIPSLGIVVAIACLLHYLYAAKNTYLFTVPLSVLLIAFAAKTMGRIAAWESNATLFTTDADATNSARVKYNYGTLLLNENADATKADALQYLEAAYAIDTADYKVISNLGIAYYRNGMMDKSLQCFHKCIAMNPKDGANYLNMGDVYFTNKNWQAAIDAYTKAIAFKSYNKQTHNKAATACFNIQDYNKALLFFKEGMQLFPDNAEMQANYANTLAMTGKYAEAITVFADIYKKDPKATAMLLKIAMCYRDMGDAKQAESYNNQYLQATGGR
jgi:protein O-mannosyl-transferase